MWSSSSLVRADSNSARQRFMFSVFSLTSFSTASLKFTALIFFRAHWMTFKFNSIRNESNVQILEPLAPHWASQANRWWFATLWTLTSWPVIWSISLMLKCWKSKPHFTKKNIIPCLHQLSSSLPLLAFAIPPVLLAKVVFSLFSACVSFLSLAFWHSFLSVLFLSSQLLCFQNLDLQHHCTTMTTMASSSSLSFLSSAPFCLSFPYLCSF